MKLSHFIVALTVLTALPAAPAHATQYAGNPNPVCKVMRNVKSSVPAPEETSCAMGLWMLIDTYFFLGFKNAFGMMTGFGALTAIGSGLAKLFEAVRLSMTPPNSQAHGSARPATEQEARAAAFGTTKTADLHDRTF